MVPDSHETMSSLHAATWDLLTVCFFSNETMVLALLKISLTTWAQNSERFWLGHFPALCIWCWAIFRSIRCFIACDSDPSHPQEKRLWWTLLGLLGSFSYYSSLLAHWLKALRISGENDSEVLLVVRWGERVKDLELLRRRERFSWIIKARSFFLDINHVRILC